MLTLGRLGLQQGEAPVWSPSCPRQSTVAPALVDRCPPRDGKNGTGRCLDRGRTPRHIRIRNPTIATTAIGASISASASNAGSHTASEPSSCIATSGCARASPMLCARWQHSVWGGEPAGSCTGVVGGRRPRPRAPAAKGRQDLYQYLYS